jgi:hypothetical protein
LSLENHAHAVAYRLLSSVFLVPRTILLDALTQLFKSAEASWQVNHLKTHLEGTFFLWPPVINFCYPNSQSSGVPTLDEVPTFSSSFLKFSTLSQNLSINPWSWFLSN